MVWMCHSFQSVDGPAARAVKADVLSVPVGSRRDSRSGARFARLLHARTPLKAIAVISRRHASGKSESRSR
jgi:hypothetical protein